MALATVANILNVSVYIRSHDGLSGSQNLRRRSIHFNTYKVLDILVIDVTLPFEPNRRLLLTWQSRLLLSRGKNQNIQANSQGPVRIENSCLHRTSGFTMAFGHDHIDTGNDYTLAFEIPPPTCLRPGMKTTIPIIVRAQAKNGVAHGQLVLFASLRDASGHRATPGLIGETSDGIHSQNNDASCGYSKFGGWSIPSPGTYRIRVYLLVATEDETIAKQFLDSDIIHVDADASAVTHAGTWFFSYRGLSQIELHYRHQHC